MSTGCDVKKFLTPLFKNLNKKVTVKSLLVSTEVFLSSFLVQFSVTDTKGYARSCFFHDLVCRTSPF